MLLIIKPKYTQSKYCQKITFVSSYLFVREHSRKVPIRSRILRNRNFYFSLFRKTPGKRKTLLSALISFSTKAFTVVNNISKQFFFVSFIISRTQKYYYIPFVDGLIDQLNIYLNKTIQITPKRRIEEVSTPVIAPVVKKTVKTSGHQKIQQNSYLLCSECFQSWTRQTCSCLNIAICDQCRSEHIKQTNTIRSYYVHSPGK
ncbi:Hypothetical_protein [Hexamita inflata]|uniref:Hypothetical_protein n=1 Tax=Hexamita inflata TaxID=28002 RepID=A0AA86NXA8_9EUKA|nr:Hypothetical protein HINF_LOCUS14435 [Hexamita inflata]